MAYGPANMPLITTAKRGIKKLFEVFGLDIHIKRSEEIAFRTSMKGALKQLSRIGFRPRTVIDVGVAYATPELYEQFRDASILLIEPLSEFEPFLRKICTNYRAQYVLAAAGVRAGTAILNVHRDKFGSSLFKEVEGRAVDGTAREIPVVTIDEVVAEKDLEGPYLIKVDVQGAELETLAGAMRVLRETEAVMIEVSLISPMIGGPQLFNVVEWMKRAGFVVYDIYGFLHRPLDGALWQVDLVFVREEGLFRTSNAFATPEQREALVCDAEALFATLARNLR
jgi:FkbM family methyltransferase